MTTAQIVSAIKNNQGNTHEIEAAFQDADQKENFSFKFGKTKEYWSDSNWRDVAKAVKGKL